MAGPGNYIGGRPVVLPVTVVVDAWAEGLLQEHVVRHPEEPQAAGAGGVRDAPGITVGVGHQKGTVVCQPITVIDIALAVVVPYHGHRVPTSDIAVRSVVHAIVDPGRILRVVVPPSPVGHEGGRRDVAVRQVLLDGIQARFS